MAHAQVTPQFDGRLCGCCQAIRPRIVEPDAARLRPSWPCAGRGVFGGLRSTLGRRFTVDGFFLTGDTAALARRAAFTCSERTADMFVSGGENVYPAEIVDASCVRIPGVADAYVFGLPDARWGRRPAAVVELTPDAPLISTRTLREALSQRLSKLYVPEQISIVDELPRSGIGKIDRAACEALFHENIDIRRVVLHHGRLPFSKPFKTPKETLTYRDTVIVEVIDRKGRVGLGMHGLRH